MRVIGHEVTIRIRGRVVGSTLTGTIESGGMIRPFDRYLPPDALMGDELSPQARMPGLKIGQQWTVPVYSPLRFSDNRDPVEVLQAKVEGQESVVIGDESVMTLAVVYRTDSGSILGASQAPRGKLWVADDGTVLKQTTHLLGSQLTFLRRQRAQRSSPAPCAGAARRLEAAMGQGTSATVAATLLCPADYRCGRSETARRLRKRRSMIELEHVRRTYGKKVAVVDLSLAVSAGQLFAFLGPNGAGKTTTIKMMVGSLAAHGGRDSCWWL